MSECSSLLVVPFVFFLSSGLSAKGMPSEAAALELAMRIETSMAVGDARALTDVMDWVAVARRGGKGLNVPEPFLAGVADGAKNWGSSILQSKGEDGTYAFLRQEERDGARWLLFRLWGLQGLNYHDYRLTQKQGRGIVMDDVFVLAGGELMSQTLRPTMLAALAQNDRSLLDRLRGKDVDFVASVPDITALTGAVQRGDGKAALKHWRRLPESVKNMKMMAILRIRAGNLVGGTAAIEAAQDFARRFPGDLALDLVLIDLHAARGNLKAAHQAIENMREAVFDDPMLYMMDAGVEINAGNTEAAKVYLNVATEKFPTLPDAWWSLLEMAITDKDDIEAVRILRALEMHVFIVFGDLTQLEFYADFVKSEEHAAWLESH